MSTAKDIGTGLAGGLIVTGLLDALLAKGVLDNSEIRGILQKAVHAVGPSISTPEGMAAFEALAFLQRERFPERGYGE